MGPPPAELAMSKSTGQICLGCPEANQDLLTPTVNLPEPGGGVEEMKLPQGFHGKLPQRMCLSVVAVSLRRKQQLRQSSVTSKLASRRSAVPQREHCFHWGLCWGCRLERGRHSRLWPPQPDPAPQADRRPSSQD